MPAAWIAKLWQIMNVNKNKKLAEAFAIFGSLMLLGLIGFPLYWLFQYHIVAFFGYLIGIIIYAFTFLLTICPVCASVKACPGGQASLKLRRVKSESEPQEDSNKE